MDRRNFLLSVSSCLLFFLMDKLTPLINVNVLNDLNKYTFKELGGYKLLELYGVKISGSKMKGKELEERQRWFLPWLWHKQ
jgi:hypothetical protein